LTEQQANRYTDRNMSLVEKPAEPTFDPPVPILFSGLTASGKSNYSSLIAESLGRPWFDATSQLLKLVGVQTDEQSVWATDLADDIQEARQGDHIDRELDGLILAKLRDTPDAVVDAWATPWLWEEDALRVFVYADEDTRVQRCLASYPAAARPTVDDARRLIHDKDSYTRSLFMRLYGFDLFNDHDDFDVVLDTSGFYEDTPEKSGKRIAQERIFPIARRLITFALECKQGLPAADAQDEMMRSL